MESNYLKMLMKLLIILFCESHLRVPPKVAKKGEHFDKKSVLAARQAMGVGPETVATDKTCITSVRLYFQVQKSILSMLAFRLLLLSILILT